LGGLIGGGSLKIRAVQAQLAVAKGSIDEGAVMRARWMVVLKGTEEAAGHAHAGYWDTALLLKRADHRDQATQKGCLLGGGELADPPPAGSRAKSRPQPLHQCQSA
jgi:hypothetical protein